MNTLRIVAISILLMITACSKAPLDFDPDPLKGSLHTVNWMGTYQGTFPCPSCDGMKTTLTLYPSNKYQISTEYLGQDPNPFRSQGSFRWDSTGNIIYLDRGQIYHVLQDKMYLLDVESQRIEGKDEQKYLVTKIAELEQ
ncbi:copper resistance protein NlpE [Shewanella donghaensis]|uniref:copper resistance protein NlpE n=1 Tax=Shewanella donghaensis TaxID=238836 RepID=UPI00131594AD|nr:copper resistance protein NlpE [Shewanella donghaensis]